MTDCEFRQACEIQNCLSSYNEKLGKIECMIDRLKELSMHGNASDIHVKLNEQWVSTPIASIDYSDLLDFLTKQRDKLNNKINDLKKEFTEL